MGASTPDIWITSIEVHIAKPLQACCRILVHPCLLSAMWKCFFSEAGGVITKKKEKKKGETHWVQAQWKKIYYFLIRLTKVFRSTITVSSFENTAKVLHKRLLSDWIYLKKRASLSDNKDLWPAGRGCVHTKPQET